MGETWHVLYLEVDSQEQVISQLKQLMAPKECLSAVEWPFSKEGYYRLPEGFHFWVAPAIQGWISVCVEFPPCVVSVKEITGALDCLAFECWIGRGNWGYLLYQGASVIDRFDSDPSITTQCKYTFSELWEPGSPYEALESGELSVDEAGEAFHGHPERLALLPLKEGTTSAELRECMDSRALYQTDIVDRFAEYVCLPNFTPQLTDSWNIKAGFQHLASPHPWDTHAKHMADSISQIEEFVPLVFGPSSASSYDRWTQTLLPLARWLCIHSALRWYEGYVNVTSLDVAQRRAAEEELKAMRALEGALQIRETGEMWSGRNSDQDGD